MITIYKKNNMKILDILVEKLDNKYITLNIILLVAFIIRIYDINFEDLWTDEIIALYTSNPDISLRRMYDVLHFWDQTPPLYPVMLWLWLKVVGFTEFQARFFSVIGGMLSLLTIYHLIKEIFNRKNALLVVFILSFIPYHIYFSREARSYIWAFFMTALVLYLFVKQLKQYDKKYTRFLFILVGGLFMHMSYFSFFVHIGLVCIIIYSYFTKQIKINLKNWIVDYIFVGVLFLPWFFQFIKILRFHNGENIDTPSFLYILEILNVFSATMAGSHILMTTYLLLLVIFLYQIIYQKKSKQLPIFFYLFIAMFLFIYVLMYIKSVRGRNILNYFMYSYVIVLFPIFLVIIAGIFSQLSKQIIALFLLLFFVANIVNYSSWGKLAYHKKSSEPYRELAQFIAKSSYANKPILCSSAYLQEFYFYKLKMDKQLVSFMDLDKKIKPTKDKYMWIIDSFDMKSEMMLQQVKQKFSIKIEQTTHIKATTGKFVFRALLLKFE